MSISIPEEKITDSLITAYMKHRRGPEGDLIWQDHFQELAEILIKHGIVSPLVRWTEITDDPATWPPVGSIVWAVNEYREVAVLMFDGFEHGRKLWRKATKMKLGHYPDEDKIVFKYSIAADHGHITHWRPIQ